MIQISMFCNDGLTAVQVAEFLVEENLVINAKLINSVEQYTSINGTAQMQSKYWISAITKGLLFSTIEKAISENFPNKEIEYYALPIVNMDWKQAEKLKSDTEKI